MARYLYRFRPRSTITSFFVLFRYSSIYVPRREEKRRKKKHLDTLQNTEDDRLNVLWICDVLAYTRNSLKAKSKANNRKYMKLKLFPQNKKIATHPHHALGERNRLKLKTFQYVEQSHSVIHTSS